MRVSLDETSDSTSLTRPGGHRPRTFSGGEPPDHRPSERPTARKQQVVRKWAAEAAIRAVEPGSFIGRRGERIYVRHSGQLVRCERVSRIESVLIGERGVSISSDALAICLANNIPVAMISTAGRPIARCAPVEGGDARLELAQLALAANHFDCFTLARRIVTGKLRSQRRRIRRLLGYWRRNSRIRDVLLEDASAIERLLAEIRELGPDVSLVKSRQTLFSLEARAATRYWRSFRAIVAPRAEFVARHGRGARDLVNSLLNYGYGYLLNRVVSATVQAGLCPNIGSLHAPRSREPVLAFDLMEEFRVPVVDACVTRAISLGRRIQVDDSGRLCPNTRELLIHSLDNRLATLVRYRGYEVTLDEIIGKQAKAYAAHVRGEALYRSFSMPW